MKRIGVFGGTFDPIHFGHLWPVEEVRKTVDLETVLYIPNVHPPHRAVPGTDATDRVNMLALALQAFPEFELDLRELNRAGPSYSVPTLESLVIDYPQHSLCLILGLDAFLDLPSWYQWQRVFALANVAVMERPGDQVPKQLPHWWQQRRCVQLADFQAHKIGKIFVLPVSQVNISATAVRSAVKTNRDIGEQVPGSVIDYISTHQLYH